MVKELKAVEAYDIWAANYDWQPGNLMLDLDEQLFAILIGKISITNKQIADIGCGTGRHWPALYRQNPSTLTGFDVSPAMLDQLNTKFPKADTRVITDNRFTAIGDASFDIIISTLTIAHIENIEEALNSWSRILRQRSDIIITDFHPSLLAQGGKRTFKHRDKQIAVENFVHSTFTIKKVLEGNNFVLAADLEKQIGEDVKHYYRAKNAMGVYEQFKGFPVIYGLHFTRG